MSPLVFVGVAVAGGLGAAARLLIDGVLRSRIRIPFRVGTMVVNLSGSFALGLVVGLVSANVLPDSVHALVGTGFLGGFTTFSTASFETVRLLQERRGIAAIINSLGMLVAGVALAAAGLACAALALSRAAGS